MGIALEQNNFSEAFFPKIIVPFDSSEIKIYESARPYEGGKFISYPVEEKEKTSFAKEVPYQEAVALITHRNRYDTENAAIDEIFKSLNQIKQHLREGSELPEYFKHEVLLPCFVEDSIHVTNFEEKTLANLRDAVNKIIYSLGHCSRFQHALAIFNSNRIDCEKLKAEVIIGAGASAARYISWIFNRAEMPYKFVTTNNPKMLDKAFITFGIKNLFDFMHPQPLHFGYTAWKEKPIKNYCYQPEFTLVRNLPIIACLDIINPALASYERSVR